MMTPRHTLTNRLVGQLERLIASSGKPEHPDTLLSTIRAVEQWLRIARGTKLDALVIELADRGITNAVVMPQLGQLRRAGEGDGDAPFDHVAVIVGNTIVMTIYGPAVERACDHWEVRTVDGTVHATKDLDATVEKVCALYAHSALNLG